MGASKRIMEMYLMRKSEQIQISTARFANVAFSDGSLLHGFNQRILKKQPIVAPNDIKRYFVTPKESGELCLMSCIFGENRDIFFPKLDKNLNLISFADIAVKYLAESGYEPHLCASEEEARVNIEELISQKKWPCLLTASDTTGEKDFEEFFTDNEVLDMNRFENLGVIKNEAIYDHEELEKFTFQINEMKSNLSWTKEMIVALFHNLIPNFGHKETGKYLDSKM
jgi:FlaA1/EpsC-like NDP-sugar epimerase